MAIGILELKLPGFISHLHHCPVVLEQETAATQFPHLWT